MTRHVVGTVALLILASATAFAQAPVDEMTYERQAQHAFRLGAPERLAAKRLEGLDAMGREATAAGMVMRQLEIELSAARGGAPASEPDEFRADHLGNRAHRIALVGLE